MGFNFAIPLESLVTFCTLSMYIAILQILIQNPGTLGNPKGSPDTV